MDSGTPGGGFAFDVQVEWRRRWAAGKGKCLRSTEARTLLEIFPAG